jgi:hypothetical protein
MRCIAGDPRMVESLFVGKGRHLPCPCEVSVGTAADQPLEGLLHSTPQWDRLSQSLRRPELRLINKVSAAR